MKARRLAAIFFALALALPLVASGGAVTAQERDDWFREPRVVGEDPEGDWGDGDGAEIGHFLGQDLVEAQIGMEDRSTVNFIIKVTFLPPWGGMPEFTRYSWNFTVGGESRELDGKWLNYSRGACDPTSGQCPPPRDPGQQPFLLRGNCGVNEDIPVISFTACEELGHIQAEFDPDEGTITIPVPLEMLEAKPGARIKGDQNIFGGSLSAAPSAWLTSAAMPMDTMVIDKVFRIPRKARR